MELWTVANLYNARLEGLMPAMTMPFQVDEKARRPPLEPFFILFLAGMAGWIALGVFMPLVSILQSLSGGGN